jgi:putative methionine-R-sulfoxide reductase with GAF domain
LKASGTRLTREQAKEVLIQLDSAIGGAKGKASREALVKLLNTSVPSYSWVGIYLVEGKDLVLDAWSGPAATEHTRIPIGKGVCGFAAKAGRTEIVSDVSKDPRYLQCFLSTKSEIVVPRRLGGGGDRHRRGPTRRVHVAGQGVPRGCGSEGQHGLVLRRSS